MHTGLPLSVRAPVGARSPLVASTCRTTIVSLSSFNANSSRPSGDNVKKRGFRPCVDVADRNPSRPLAGSTRNAAMLSCPRLEAYSVRPASSTAIPAERLFPVKHRHPWRGHRPDWVAKWEPAPRSASRVPSTRRHRSRWTPMLAIPGLMEPVQTSTPVTSSSSATQGTPEAAPTVSRAGTGSEQHTP